MLAMPENGHITKAEADVMQLMLLKTESNEGKFLAVINVLTEWVSPF